MPFDQLAIRHAGLAFTDCRKALADGIEHESLNFGRRHPSNAARLGGSLLHERVRDIIAIAHPELVGVRRSHAVAVVIEDATGQNGGRAPEPVLPSHRAGGELGLDGVKQVALKDRLMFPAIYLSPIDYVAHVEPVLEQMGKRPDPQTNTAAHSAIGKAIGFGANSAAPRPMLATSRV